MRARGDRALRSLLWAGLLGLGGCVTYAQDLGYESWTKEKAGPTEFEADRSDCLAVATQPVPLVVRGNVQAVEVDDYQYRQCMQERGWSRRSD